MATAERSATPSGAAETDLEQTRRIVLEGLGQLEARVWLFGSRARGAARRGSDIDVAVLPLEPLPAGTLGRIAEALENSLVLPTVDLVDLTSAEPALIERVERDGIPWKS